MWLIRRSLVVSGMEHLLGTWTYYVMAGFHSKGLKPLRSKWRKLKENILKEIKMETTGMLLMTYKVCYKNYPYNWISLSSVRGLHLFITLSTFLFLLASVAIWSKRMEGATILNKGSTTWLLILQRKKLESFILLVTQCFALVIKDILKIGKRY